MVTLEGVAPSSWVYKTHALLLSYRAMFAVVPQVSLCPTYFRLPLTVVAGRFMTTLKRTILGRYAHRPGLARPQLSNDPCGRYYVVKVLRVCLMPFPSKRPACLAIMRLISATYKDLWRCCCSVLLYMLHLRGHRSVECAT